MNDSGVTFITTFSVKSLKFRDDLVYTWIDFILNKYYYVCMIRTVKSFIKYEQCIYPLFFFRCN